MNSTYPVLPIVFPAPVELSHKTHNFLRTSAMWIRTMGQTNKMPDSLFTGNILSREEDDHRFKLF